jgi:hypothetical protein
MITVNARSRELLFQVFNRLRLWEQATLMLEGKPYIKIRHSSFARFFDEMPTDKYTIEHRVHEGAAPMVVNVLLIRFRKNEHYPEVAADIIPTDFAYKTIFQQSVHGHFRNEITLNLQYIDDHVRLLDDWLSKIDVLEMQIALTKPNYSAEN